METKPGIKTTEFWATLVAQLVSIGLMTGVISPAEGAIVSDAAPVITGGALSAISLVAYIVSRIKAKGK